MTQSNKPTSGLSSWSIRHPVSVVMITLAVMVLGAFSLGSLKIDLLPHIIYPEIMVRIMDPGVPANILEDEVTRQLEEQLAITEDAIHISSNTREGRSSVELSFPYSKDIDIALRDASTRLDRAKRFLPDTIEAPVIFKRDPSQLPAAEYAISSSSRDSIALREWVDYSLGKWLINVPGVAAAEVAGGLQREIQVLIDQDRLAALGLDILDIEKALQAGNKDIAAGRLQMANNEITSRTSGRIASVEELTKLPLLIYDDSDNKPRVIELGELATIIDGAEEERIRIRLNDAPGVKLSIQKQPQANTVAVVDQVNHKLDELRDNGLIPKDITIAAVGDEAIHIRRALNNAISAALGGGVLAMIVVYLFLGSIRRTLIIGSAIPIAVLVTITLMSASGLTLNIMSLGGLALGVGMLVDSTIVMLENIYRHQRADASSDAVAAASEVNSAIVAATSTNLAAILPFLFISGLIGLLFRELIITISAAVLASMLVALTLVPALAGHIPAKKEGWLRQAMNRIIGSLQNGYAWMLDKLLSISWLVITIFLLLLATVGRDLAQPVEVFLPRIDDGRISINLTADRSVSVAEMNNMTQRIESMISNTGAVDSILTTVGGYTFGRSSYQSPNRASIKIQLTANPSHKFDSATWIAQLRKSIRKEKLVGIKVRIRQRGIRGLHLGRGSDDISFNVKGTNLEQLELIGRQMADSLRQMPMLRNVTWSNENTNQELSIQVDRKRAKSYGLSVEDIGNAVRFALAGKTVTDFIANDRSINILLKLEQTQINTPEDLERIILFSKTEPRVPLRLREVASTHLTPAPATIKRDQQQRIVEVSASLNTDAGLEKTIQQVTQALQQIQLPEGYSIYESGSLQTLQEGRDLSYLLMGLAMFLVLVVMAVQYESLRNPLIILFSIAFAAIGVALGLQWTNTPISMPVWLGMIMLAGIVVNNAIVLVEYIELERARGTNKRTAIIQAGRLRLRPILMTTLTTVLGMLPLALALGEGSEMLQPLAITIISGLLFSLFVSLLLVPATYYYLGSNSAR